MAADPSHKMKFPAYQFYPRDCDSDENVRAMSNAEFGFYVRCLNHAWINQGLPSDLCELARVIPNTSKVEFNKVWKRVSQCWIVDQARPDRFINRRQEEQRAQYVERSAKGSQAAKKRWAEKGDADALPTHDDCI